MFVHRMLGPEDYQNEITLDPTWQQIEAALLRLDNQKCTDLTLRAENQDPSLNIGGGKVIWMDAGYWDTLYFVFATDSEGNAYILYDPTIKTDYPYPERINICCGGQTSDRPAQACVNQTLALQAAKTFCERGERDRSLHWHKDEPWNR